MSFASVSFVVIFVRLPPSFSNAFLNPFLKSCSVLFLVRWLLRTWSQLLCYGRGRACAAFWLLPFAPLFACPNRQRFLCVVIPEISIVFCFRARNTQLYYCNRSPSRAGCYGRVLSSTFWNVLSSTRFVNFPLCSTLRFVLLIRYCHIVIFSLGFFNVKGARSKGVDRIKGADTSLKPTSKSGKVLKNLLDPFIPLCFSTHICPILHLPISILHNLF